MQMTVAVSGTRVLEELFAPESRTIPSRMTIQFVGSEITEGNGRTATKKGKKKEKFRIDVVVVCRVD